MQGFSVVAVVIIILLLLFPTVILFYLFFEKKKKMRKSLWRLGHVVGPIAIGGGGGLRLDGGVSLTRRTPSNMDGGV